MVQKNHDDERLSLESLESLPSFAGSGGAKLSYANDALARALNEVEQIAVQIRSRETQLARSLQQVTEAEDRVARLESCVAEEQAAVASVKVELRQSLKDRWRIEAEVRAANDLLARERERAVKLAKRVQEQDGRLAEMGRAIRRERKLSYELQTAKSELDSAQESLRSLCEARDEKTKQIETLTEERNELSRDVRSLHQELLRAKRDAANRQQAVALEARTLAEERDALAGALREREKEFLAWLEIAEELKDSLTDANASVSRYQSLTESLRSELGRARAQSANLRNELHRSLRSLRESMTAEANATLLARDRELEKLAEEVTTARDDARHWHGRSEALEAILNRERDEAAAERADHQRRLDAKGEEIGRIRMEAAELRTRFVRLVDAEFERTRLDVIHLSTAINTIQSGRLWRLKAFVRRLLGLR